MNIEFKNMTQEYSKEVIDIFNYYAENTFAAYPESKLPNEFFYKFLEITKGYPAFVIKNKNDDKIIGFCFLRAYRPFPVFRETAEVTYFIEKNEVGKGIGKEALKKLEGEAKKIGINKLLADISSENIQSINFHKKNGFTECGRFQKIGKKKGRYFDVVWMEKTLK
jgi:L-amino acid N-acyltransferase YncA